MLVVFDSDKTKECVEAVYRCGASIIAEIGRAVLVRGSVPTVNEALKNMADVACPTCSTKENLLRKYPDCEMAIGIWEAHLQRDYPPMTTEEAARLQPAIHSEPEVFMSKSEIGTGK